MRIAADSGKGLAHLADQQLLDPVDDRLMQPGPVAEVSVEHRLGRPRLRRKGIHAQIGAVTADRLDGHLDQFGAARLARSLPTAAATVDPRRGGITHTTERYQA